MQIDILERPSIAVLARPSIAVVRDEFSFLSTVFAEPFSRLDLAGSNKYRDIHMHMNSFVYAF